MNIYVEGDKKTHQKWTMAAEANGMTLAQFVATAVRNHWKTDLLHIENAFVAINGTSKFHNELTSERNDNG